MEQTFAFILYLYSIFVVKLLKVKHFKWKSFYCNVIFLFK